MNKTVAAMLCFATLWSESSSAAESYLAGQIVDVTSVAEGLMVRLSSGIPTNCNGAQYGWMLIPESSKTMVAAALMTWQNKSGATVYTDGLVNGYCRINQFDPWEG